MFNKLQSILENGKIIFRCEDDGCCKITREEWLSQFIGFVEIDDNVNGKCNIHAVKPGYKLTVPVNVTGSSIEFLENDTVGRFSYEFNARNGFEQGIEDFNAYNARQRIINAFEIEEGIKQL